MIKIYTKHICEGLLYLHVNKIIHRDIKGANILLTNDGVCKLADFGEAKKLMGQHALEQCNSIRGTANWMAPEVIRQSNYGRHADIWSVGCTVLEMATGKPPWSQYGNKFSALYNIAKAKDPPKIPEELSNQAKDFIL